MGRAFKLTAQGVERLRTPGLYGDGAGLWLKVRIPLNVTACSTDRDRGFCAQA